MIVGNFAKTAPGLKLVKKELFAKKLDAVFFVLFADVVINCYDELLDAMETRLRDETDIR
jgi:hypothetical protein